LHVCKTDEQKEYEHEQAMQQLRESAERADMPARITKLQAENEKLRESIGLAIGIIRASAQVNTKVLANKLEQSLKG